MKISRHKFLILIIIIALSVAACVPQVVTPTLAVVTTSPTQQPTHTNPTITPTPVDIDFGVKISDLEKLQIHFMHPWTGSALDELTKMVDEFNQTNGWGIHVIMDSPGSTGMVISKTWEGIANDLAPNVLATPPSFTLAIDKRENLVLDLSPYLESASYGLTPSETSDFSPQFWNELFVGEKRIGIPAQQSALFLAYNESWANELGFEQPPVNDAEFKTQMCAANAGFLKDDDTLNDGLGGWLINTDPVAIYSWLSAFGVEPRSNDGYSFSGEAGEKAFNFLLNLKNDSCAWVGRSAQDATYFTNRQALAITVWLQDLPALKREMQSGNSKDEWTVIPFPGSEQQVVATSGIAYSVLTQDPAEDLAAWLFIRWLSQPGQQVKLLNQLGTLPLHAQVEKNMSQALVSHQWQAVLQNREFLTLQPMDADWVVISPVLEDAGWQLLKTEMSTEKIPGVLEEIDSLTTELAESYP